jgi:hypothetical protein
MFEGTTVHVSHDECCFHAPTTTFVRTKRKGFAVQIKSSLIVRSDFLSCGVQRQCLKALNDWLDFRGQLGVDVVCIDVTLLDVTVERIQGIL